MPQPALYTDLDVSDVEVVVKRPTQIVGIRELVRVAALQDHSRRTPPRVVAELRRAGMLPSGPPVSIRRQRSDGTFEVTVGYPTRQLRAPGTPLAHDLLPGGRAVQAVHRGAYTSLLSSYDRLAEWLAGHRIPPIPIMWEEYLTGPDTTDDPAAWRTRIAYPLPPPGPADPPHAEGMLNHV